jgi:hypothetical protein
MTLKRSLYVNDLHTRMEESRNMEQLCALLPTLDWCVAAKSALASDETESAGANKLQQNEVQTDGSDNDEADDNSEESNEEADQEAGEGVSESEEF